MMFKRRTSLAAAAMSVFCMTAIVFAAGQTIMVPQRPVPPAPTVAIVKDNTINFTSMVAQALEAALGTGGIGNLVSTDQTVLIKPNLTMNYTPAVTDWRLVRALVDQILTVNNRAAIYIADGSSTNSASNNTHTIMAGQGYTAINFPEVTFLDFNSLTECPTNDFVLADHTIETDTKRLAALLSEVNVVINMPKMKTHTNTGISCAVKNYGLGVPSYEIQNIFGYSNKNNLHRDTRLQTVDHILCRVPDFSMMDAIQAMEGQGPGGSGTPVTMNLVIASRDPVAVDAVACQIMAMEPYLITHLVVAANENVGVMDLNATTITGNTTIAAVKRYFARATLDNGLALPPSETMLIPYRASTVIRPAPVGMSIDGSLSEWGNANLFTVNLAEQVRGNGFDWGGPSDCSIRGQFLYDDYNLYVAVNVRDNAVMNNSATGAAIRNGESIELYIGTDTNQYNGGHPSTGDNRFDHVLGISCSSTPQAYMFSHNVAVTGFTASKIDIGDGYVIEAQIPWANFNNFAMTPYRQLGLNVALNDADVNATTVDDKVFWNAAKDADVETNPHKNGIAYLDPVGGLYAIPAYTLNVTAVNGTVVKSPSLASYDAGTVVTLTPTPNSGYIFRGWSGDAGGTLNPTGVVMNGPKNITAVFDLPPAVRSIVVSPTGARVGAGGTVQFTAVAFDQYGVQLPSQPTFTWSVSGGGTIAAGGLFTAGTTAGGPYTVTATSGTVNGTAAVTVASGTGHRINTGSSTAVAPFTGDQFSNGGTQYTVTNTITISGITNPAPQAVYQSERYGNITYTIPSLTANSPYTVRLHFAELYWTATGKRVFNVQINGALVLSNFDLYSVAGARYKAVLREFSATSNASGQIVIKLITVTDNATIAGIEVLPPSSLDLAPTISTPASAFPASVTSSATALSVLGADDNGEANLTYTWAAAGTPPAAVTFSANGTNAAKATTATFTRAGTYALQVTVKDQSNLTAVGSVNVIVHQLTTSMVVTPSNLTLAPRATQQYTAMARDQFGVDIVTPPVVVWSLSSGLGGRLFANGQLVASSTTGGPFNVIATSGAVSGSAVFTIATAPVPPTVATPASASPNPVAGTTTALSVLGADDNGEANLTYTWAATGTPPAAVTFSANGTNAAKAATATFTRAGTYTLRATITDQNSLFVTSSVDVIVNQTLTSVIVTPANADVPASSSRQFTAAARDQFAVNLSTQPTFTWTVSGGGTISATGLFTAGTTTGGPHTITAASGGLSGTANATVVPQSVPVYRINCGSSSAVSPFAADQYGSGGTQHTVTNSITTSGIVNPAPQAVYQSERYGTTTYTMPGLTAGATYNVRLHFAELYWTATGKRVFNVQINNTTVISNFDLYAVAGARYKAVLREFTATANGSGQIVIKFNTVTDNATISGIEIITSTPGVPPTIATPAAATPSPVTGTTTTLTVLGADDNGENNLVYTWATVSTPPAAVNFSVNGTNTAKTTTATFTKAGTYAFEVTVKDAGNLTVTSSVAVVVNQTLTSAVMSPTSASVAPSATQQFTVTARDQFSTNLTVQPTFTWTVSGGGTISASGLFTAGTAVGGPYTVTAASGGISGAASVTISVNPVPPTVATAASATPNPVTGASAVLSVLGADENGEANLTYTWATTGTPPAAVTFSANGTNAAKTITATFTKAGNYTLQATIRDQDNLTVTSSVAVPVSQTLTSIVVSPASAEVATSATRQFTATARDQFAANLSTQPTFTWAVSGGGTVSSSGLFTAGGTVGSFTVTATSAAVSATASVTVIVPTSPVYRINCGSGSVVTPYTADQYYSGGTQASITNAITISGIVNPAPQAVYQSERYGATTYTMPGLNAGVQYNVRLHFAEQYWTATGKRVFNVAINGSTVLSNFDLYAVAGARYKAVLREFTATANGSGQIIINFSTVTDNASISGIEILPAVPAIPPTIATPAAAIPSPVTGTTTALTVLGADDNGEPALIYTWAATGTPPAAVNFSVNGNNAAKATTATFTKVGTYALQVTVKDASNLTVTSSVSVIVNPTLTSVVVTPSAVSVTTSSTQQFTALARDQFATNLVTQPVFTWTVSGGGTISSSGLFTAGTVAGGPYTVTAASGAVSGTANVTVAVTPVPPTVASPATATPNPVTGTTAALSVLGADDNGEANLTYTWATTGTPPATVTFSANGTNAAKAATATFTKAGSYSLQATIRDQNNLTVTSAVAVTVNQTLTSITVTPASVSIAPSATQQYTAAARDQFATNLTSQPTFTWSVSGGGTISSGGMFTAGTTAGGPYAVTAASGSVSASAQVTVAPVSTGFVMYDDQLATGYGNYSWGGTYNLNDASPVKVGAKSISITYTAGWGGLQLQKNSGTQTHTGFTSYSFWAHGGASGTRQCQFYTRTNAGQESNHVNVDIPSGIWTRITVTLSALGNPADAKTVVLQDRSGSVNVEFNIDQLELN